MVNGLLMELEDYNCWSIAEAVGHRGPHRLQHLLSRAAWDDEQVLDAAVAWAVARLDDDDAVLVVDETADEKSSADAVIWSPFRKSTTDQVVCGVYMSSRSVPHAPTDP